MNYTLKKEKQFLYIIREDNKAYIYDCNESKMYGFRGTEVKTFSEIRSKDLINLMVCSDDMYFKIIGYNASFSACSVKDLLSAIDWEIVDLFYNLPWMNKYWLYISAQYSNDFLYKRYSKKYHELKESKSAWKKFLEQIKKAMEGNEKISFSQIYQRFKKEMVQVENEKYLLPYEHQLTENDKKYFIDYIHNHKDKLTDAQKKSLAYWVGQGIRCMNSLSPYNMVQELSLYWGECDEMSIPYENTPNFVRLMSKTNKVYKVWKNTQINTKIAEMAERFKWLKEFSNEDLEIIIPKTVEEFVKEGKAQNNCIGYGGYSEKVSEGSKLVFFVRKKDNPTKSFITADLNIAKNNSIRLNQFYYHSNGEVTDSSLPEYKFKLAIIAALSERG